MQSSQSILFKIVFLLTKTISFRTVCLLDQNNICGGENRRHVVS